MHQFKFTNENGEEMTARLPIGDEDFFLLFEHEAHPGAWKLDRPSSWRWWPDADAPWRLTRGEGMFVGAVIRSAKKASESQCS
jgi:hypothetical protein